MKAYSDDLRERIVLAAEHGMRRREMVAVFRVSLATINRYLKQRRDSGHLQPKRRPGRPAHKGQARAAALTEHLRIYPVRPWTSIVRAGPPQPACRSALPR